MHFGPNLTYLESFKGRVPKKAKMRKNTLKFETPPEFFIFCRGSSTVLKSEKNSHNFKVWTIFAYKKWYILSINRLKKCSR